jgi:hypothetical protein
MEELNDRLAEEKQKHEQRCNELTAQIEEQRRQLLQLQEIERKDRLKHRMNHDAETSDNLTMLWSENHQDKMERMAGRLRYLYDENQLLHDRLHSDRDRHIAEMKQLEQQYKQAKAKTTEAKQVLQLERSYYDTCVNLLEAGLERETQKVQALQEKLRFQQLRAERRQGRRIDDPLPARTRQFHPFHPAQPPPFQPYTTRQAQEHEQHQQHQQQEQQRQQEQYRHHHRRPSQPPHEPLRRQRHNGPPTTTTMNNTGRRRGSTTYTTISSMNGREFRIDINTYFQ